jgi:hypothetical protein
VPVNIELASIEEFLQARKTVLAEQGITDFNWPAFKERLDEMNHKNPNGSRSGDIVAIMDDRKGYLTVNIESEAYVGWHGGPTVSESFVPLVFGMPGDAFVDADGDAIQTPPQLIAGFAKGVSAAGVKDDGYLRNWHLTSILREILLEFRSAD